MGAKPATECRFCHKPGDLYKGAHRECKNLAGKEYIRKKNGSPPERWQSEVDRKATCNQCNLNPREGKSLSCAACRADRRHEVRAKHMLAYKKRRTMLRRMAQPSKVCVCGCGAEFKDYRKRYATIACRPPREKKPAKPQPIISREPKPKKGSWTTVAPSKPKADEPKEWRIVVPPGLKITKCPPVGPQSRWD